MPPNVGTNGAENGRKIAEVVDRTGVSKELIHHYLRQGLLPASEEKARYSEHQVRLLNLIRVLREEHYLPLESIRQVFEVFEYDADDLEALVLAEPLAHRLTGYAAGRDLSLALELTRDELTAAAGISTERLEHYLEQRVIEPVRTDGRERFTNFDVNAIRLCERGTALNIPFESFRTIASYMRVSFEMESQEFFLSLKDEPRTLEQYLNKAFVRRELVGAFLQNLLQTLEHRFLGDLLQGSSARSTRLVDVIFQPSPAFLRRHGLREVVERRTDRMSASPADPEAWLEAADVLIHVGRYREATFFLEQALERWPERTDIHMHYGMALSLSGELVRGERQLRAVVEDPDATPLALIYLALILFARSTEPSGDGNGGDERVTCGVHIAAEIRTLVDRAVGVADARLELRVQLFGGWLLTALPPAFRDLGRGLEHLLATHRELEGDAPRAPGMPGLRERYRVNTASLLLDAMWRSGGDPGLGSACPDGDGLRDLICRLDPASRFAENAYLEGDALPEDERR